MILSRGSILEENWWEDGDIIFANSTCFDDNLMESMGKLAERLKPGAIFVTFTKGLHNSHPNVGVISGDEDQYAFELLDRKRYQMSWGPATVFIHRRLTPDGKRVNDGYTLSLLPSDEDTYESSESKNVDTSKNQRTAAVLAKQRFAFRILMLIADFLYFHNSNYYLQNPTSL